MFRRRHVHSSECCHYVSGALNLPNVDIRTPKQLFTIRTCTVSGQQLNLYVTNNVHPTPITVFDTFRYLSYDGTFPTQCSGNSQMTSTCNPLPWKSRTGDRSDRSVTKGQKTKWKTQDSEQAERAGSVVLFRCIVTVHWYKTMSYVTQ